MFQRSGFQISGFQTISESPVDGSIAVAVIAGGVAANQHVPHPLNSDGRVVQKNDAVLIAEGHAKQALDEHAAQQAAIAAINAAIARADALIAAKRFEVTEGFARIQPPAQVVVLPIPAPEPEAVVAVADALKLETPIAPIAALEDMAVQARRRGDEEALMMILMELA